MPIVFHKYATFREQVERAARKRAALPSFAPEVGIVKDNTLPLFSDRAAEREIRFVISTANPDRERDTIAVSGWDLTAYMRNPVVMWDHGMGDGIGRLPIGRAIDVGPENGVLMATVRFIPADYEVVGPHAQVIMRMLQDGFLSATSVGFRPLEYAVSEDPDRETDGWFPGIDFTRQELLEFSVVSIPCNSEALIVQPQDQDDVPVGVPPPVVTDPVRSAEEQAVKARRGKRPFAFI